MLYLFTYGKGHSEDLNQLHHTRHTSTPVRCRDQISGVNDYPVHGSGYTIKGGDLYAKTIKDAG